MVPRQLQPGSEAGLGPWSRLRLCHEELQILDGQAETEVTETQTLCQTELKFFFLAIFFPHDHKAHGFSLKLAPMVEKMTKFNTLKKGHMYMLQINSVLYQVPTVMAYLTSSIYHVLVVAEDML